MESTRFFVANLPSNTTENDLKFIFQDYGPIKNIELKTKENLVDPDNIKIIAFVTLNIGADDAQYYLKDLNWHKVHGQNIRVSIAKESFLERLKREREEAQGGSDDTLQAKEQTAEFQSELLHAPRENKRKTFDVDGELDDDEVAPELMISKKRASSSMHNGRIVIQSLDVQPIHVIETKQKKHKQLDTKSSNADQKRKESLNKMKNQYQQNKTAIQQALQGLDVQPSKKIKFSDAESDSEIQKPQESVKKSSTNIFGSEDESDEDDVGFKSVPTGKKGEKLIQMQATQSLDPRFRIGANFVDDEEDDETSNKKGQENNDDENSVDDERQWQMNILEQVVGTKLDTVKSADKSQKNKKMLRYDPSKDEHQKFERSRKDDIQIKKSKEKQNKTKDSNTEDNSSAAPEKVSKEVFYVVTDTLQQSLRTRGEGFSLLNMFGKTEESNERDEQLKQLGNEKILVNNNKLDKSFTVNPFSYDSSSESESEEQLNEQENVGPQQLADNKNNQNVKKSKKKPKIATESFFIPKNDIRLKEGAKFFIYKKIDDTTTENYEEVRNRLKLLIKTKITKTKKNLANAGYKGKRKV